MMSNDDFLYSFRKRPSEEFSQSLYQHLIQNDERQRRKQRNMWFIASTIVVCVLLLGAGSIPGVRAAIVDSFEEIAGIQFMETTDYPGDDSVTTIPSIVLTLDDAREEFGFALPEWEPEGYIVDDTVRVVEIDGSTKLVTITWRNQGKGNINLDVMPNEHRIVIGPESVHEIEVNGREVAVWQGGWNYDTKKWDDSISAITLSWSDDGITAYHLSGPESAVSIDDLIRMVESIP